MRHASQNDWIGVYASMEEGSHYGGTVLAIENGPHGDIDYRERWTSDVGSPGNRQGTCLIDGPVLYLPQADEEI